MSLDQPNFRDRQRVSREGVASFDLHHPDHQYQSVSGAKDRMHLKEAHLVRQGILPPAEVTGDTAHRAPFSGRGSHPGDSGHAGSERPEKQHVAKRHAEEHPFEKQSQADFPHPEGQPEQHHEHHHHDHLKHHPHHHARHHRRHPHHHHHLHHPVHTHGKHARPGHPAPGAGHDHQGGDQTPDRPQPQKFADGAYDGIKPPDSATFEKSVKTVLAEAQKLGLSKDATRAVVAAMLVESKGNPQAVGDHGHSFGLFQLNDRGELKEALQKGVLKNAQEAFDPVKNADVALATFKHFEGKYHDPGALAAAAQRPKNRGQYAARVDQLLHQADELIAKYGSS